VARIDAGAGMIDCPACGRDTASQFLRRDAVPVHQNLVYASEAAALSAARGDLHLACCSSCGFVFNTAFDFSKLSYGDDYANDQTWSPAFSAYVDGLVRHLVEERGVRDSTVVEVGCGRGYFLRRLVEYPGANNRGIGFDPSYSGPDSDLDGRLRFERRYYGPDCTDVAADVVVCRHVIEHLPRPAEVVGQVHAALASSPAARLFFETPDVEWILRNDVIWDFFYEHCSLFTARALALALRKAGFRSPRVEHVFGGQYLWAEAATDGPDEAVDPEQPCDLNAFAGKSARFAAHWREQVRAAVAQGPVALWGAGAKGVTFALMTDPENRLIDHVVDINPSKQNHHIAGSGLKVLAPEAAAQRGARTIFVMNPNYLEEITATAAQTGMKAQLVSIN
jgi:SAM-dependent methyltransferase